MKPPTQLDRVLRASRSYRGCCQADFLAPDVVDGGAPITRVGARIQELEDRRQCAFECIGWRNKTKVFRLVSGPGAERSPVDGSPLPSPPGRVALSAEPESERLFTTAGEPHWRESDAA